jgi:hypothetical protein
MGGWPNKRLYSRLNWLALSYPTSNAHSRRVDIVGDHPCSRGLQSNLLLVLKRAHCCERPEMMVKRSYGHACNVGKLLNAKRPAIVRLNPGDCFSRAVTLVSQGRDCS